MLRTNSTSPPAHTSLVLGSARAELFTFYLPLLFSVPFLLLIQLPQAKSSLVLSFLILQGFGLAPFHLGTTWFHATDRKIRSYFCGSWIKLFKCVLCATAIVSFSLAGMIYCPSIVLGIYVVWTVQHLTQQNVGILLLHHNFGGNELVVERTVEVRTLHAAAWFFSLCFIAKFAPTHSLTQIFCGLALLASFLDLVASLAKYFGQVKSQLLAGKKLNIAAQSFWLLSVLFMLPLAVGRDFNEALLMPLVLHWFQYIGLNLYLIKRKYAGANRDLLVFKTNPTLQFIAVATIFTLFFIALGAWANLHCHGWQKEVLFGLVLSLGMIHYLHDAFLWRFREPYLRKELLAYIKNTSPVTSNVVLESAHDKGEKGAGALLAPL